MFKRKIIYSLFIGLLMAAQAPLSANAEQVQPVSKEQSRIVQLLKNKTLRIIAGTGTLLAITGMIYFRVYKNNLEQDEYKVDPTQEPRTTQVSFDENPTSREAKDFQGNAADFNEDQVNEKKEDRARKGITEEKKHRDQYGTKKDFPTIRSATKATAHSEQRGRTTAQKKSFEAAQKAVSAFSKLKKDPTSEEHMEEIIFQTEEVTRRYNLYKDDAGFKPVYDQAQQTLQSANQIYKPANTVK